MTICINLRKGLDWSVLTAVKLQSRDRFPPAESERVRESERERENEASVTSPCMVGFHLLLSVALLTSSTCTYSQTRGRVSLT